MTRQPSVLRLQGEARGTRESIAVYIVFDRNGALVGAPIVWRSDPDRSSRAWLSQTIEGATSCFMVLSEFTAVATTQPAATPTTGKVVFHVYRLARSESVEVFAIHCDWAVNQWPWLEATRRDDRVTLHLKVSPAGKSNLQTVATFVWDESLGRFVGPQHDPQGRWEVIFPPPDPGETTQ